MKNLSGQGNSRRIVGEGTYLRLVDEESWEFVERTKGSGVVAIAAVTDDGRLVLVEQFRMAVGRNVVDLPAGLAGDISGAESEELPVAAGRELMEETGFRAEGVEFLAAGPTSPGLSSEVVSFFLAKNLTRCGPGGGDDSEDITVHEIPLVGVREWLLGQAQRHVHVDPKVYAGLYLARLG